MPNKPNPEGKLSPFEKEIRDLLHESQIVPMRTPGEVDNAKQLAEELKNYAEQAIVASFPYTAQFLLDRKAGIEKRLRLMQNNQGGH